MWEWDGKLKTELDWKCSQIAGSVAIQATCSSTKVKALKLRARRLKFTHKSKETDHLCYFNFSFTLYHTHVPPLTSSFFLRWRTLFCSMLEMIQSPTSYNQHLYVVWFTSCSRELTSLNTSSVWRLVGGGCIPWICMTHKPVSYSSCCSGNVHMCVHIYLYVHATVCMLAYKNICTFVFMVY